MYGMSISHILIVVLVVIVLFGKNKISSIMSDIGGGIKNFKLGMKELEK